ncbi:glycerophosphodiester phosphodiesterase GDPD1, chloroplastic-like [Diospyros lotus]|uniref:glycerophosphodiester phosphodiesterase GDPD1, chloroplastic-like n=1 Tax=Diospyros lotus TaxID=55363 RepID=UPI0022581F36|nr:glycerophosphodiester phosphodiesterase GDPD1, chloroplastic-like [Diospyros lotus]
MALKAFVASDVPYMDPAALSFCFAQLFRGEVGDDGKSVSDLPRKFMVIGHRGCGMNMVQSSDRRMKSIKENSILSFNAAGKFLLDFIEFDVQVTKDDCPVIFHDNYILTEEKGAIVEKRVTDLTSAEFLSYGPQKKPEDVGKPLFRKTKDGTIFEWKVENDDSFCTLEEVFQKVEHSFGFNIELKFDDNIVYKEEDMIHTLQVVLKVVYEYGKDRAIIFSSFHPDAAQLMRKLQTTYPVFFLTNGGSKTYKDIRRNSLEEAVKLCLASGLQGIVCEVKAILRNPGAVKQIKGSSLSLITYGQLNNVAEVVYMQHMLGVDGVIVDLVQEISESVSEFTRVEEEGQEEKLKEAKQRQGTLCMPHLSQDELAFLLKLVSKVMHKTTT